MDRIDTTNIPRLKSHPSDKWSVVKSRIYDPAAITLGQIDVWLIRPPGTTRYATYFLSHDSAIELAKFMADNYYMQRKVGN